MSADWRAEVDRPRTPGVLWMLGVSCWMLFTLVPLGYTSFISFLLVGILLRNRRWITTGVVYLVAMIIVQIVFATVAYGDYLVPAGLAFQCITVVHAAVLNPRVLGALWGRIERGERVTGRPGRSVPGATARGLGASDAAPEAGHSGPAEGVLGDGTSRFDYMADRRRASETDARQEPKAGPEQETRAEQETPASKQSLVDVNSASRDELADVPGIGKRAADRAIRLREGEPFDSVQDFADRLGLQPHEYARLRSRLTCSRIAPRRTSGGRRIEL